MPILRYLKRKGYIFLCLVSLMSLSEISMQSQTAVDGAIGGTVLDLSGSVVSGANIVVHNNGTNAEQTVNADSSGYFRATHLQSGSYNVIVTAPGYGAFRSNDVTVSVGLVTNFEAKLTVGATAQTVEVTGEEPALNTISPEFSNVVGQHLLTDLPVSNYRWSNFALLTPGVVESGGYGLLSFRGQSTLFNNVTVDGADDNQAFSPRLQSRNFRSTHPTHRLNTAALWAASSTRSPRAVRIQPGTIRAPWRFRRMGRCCTWHCRIGMPWRQWMWTRARSR